VPIVSHFWKRSTKFHPVAHHGASSQAWPWTPAIEKESSKIKEVKPAGVEKGEQLCSRRATGRANNTIQKANAGNSPVLWNTPGRPGFEPKVRMGWLRRTISVIFATVVAIGVNLVFVPVAALIDPVTRGAGYALTQYAVLALDADYAVGSAGGDFALFTQFVWMAVVTVCAVPVIVVALIGEIARVRAFFWYASATGFVAASAPWLIRATLHLPRAADYNFAELRFALVFFLGGLISGSVYWLLAGCNAGGRASI
jgi:hypothetical protein